MYGPSDRRFDLNFGEEAAMPFEENIWHPSFLSPTGPLTIRDSEMKDDMTAVVVARNLLTLKDIRLLSKRSDELAVKDSLALSVQCAGAALRNEAPNDQPSVPPPSGVLPSTEAPNNHPLVPPLSGALLTAESSSGQPLHILNVPDHRIANWAMTVR
ncbi:unnamed protein product [Malus baccata var. baccata]